MTSPARVPLLALGAIAASLLAAGCGSSAPKATTGSPRTASELAYSRCMRANGVPDFPDPGTIVGGPANMIGGIAIPATIDVQAPAFQTAQTACRRLLATALSRQGRPQISATIRASLIAHAQCMRTHGVPGYQDPTFPAGGGIAITDAGTDPQSPAYQHAQTICGGR